LQHLACAFATYWVIVRIIVDHCHTLYRHKPHHHQATIFITFVAPVDGGICRADGMVGGVVPTVNMMTLCNMAINL
jgi:hypothetical protein